MRRSLIAVPLLLTLALTACAARTGAPAADGVEASADGQPVILNRSRALQDIQRFYPELLRDAQVTGEVIVLATVTAGGAVSETDVVRSSHHLFDTPARAVAKRLLFTAPGVDGQQVRLRINFARPGLADIRVTR